MVSYSDGCFKLLTVLLPFIHQSLFLNVDNSTVPSPSFLPSLRPLVSVGNMYRMVDFSDDGSTVAFSGWIGAANVPTAYVFNGQTGALKWSYTPPAGTKPGNIGVNVGLGGNFIAFTNSPFTYILNGADGSLRGSPIPSEFAGYVSDSGSYVATVGASSAFIYSWANNAYSVAYTIPTPQGCDQGCIYPWTVAMAADDAAVEYAAFGWISGDVMQTQVTAYALTSGLCVANYTSPRNTKKLQVRANRQFTLRIMPVTHAAATSCVSTNQSIPYYQEAADQPNGAR